MLSTFGLLLDDDVAEGGQDEKETGGLRVVLRAVVHDVDGTGNGLGSTWIMVEGGEFIGEDDEGGSEEEVAGVVLGIVGQGKELQSLQVEWVATR